MVLSEDKYIGRFLILDCRFLYEFEGGHIKGAENVPTPAGVQKFFQDVSPGEKEKRLIIIFHCEFSSNRAPETLRALRKLDRALNIDKWPHLNYPELYLLEGGYSAFWSKYPELCEPQGYVKMGADQKASKSGHLMRKNSSSLLEAFCASPSAASPPGNMEFVRKEGETVGGPLRGSRCRIRTSPRRFQDRLKDAETEEQEENKILIGYKEEEKKQSCKDQMKFLVPGILI